MGNLLTRYQEWMKRLASLVTQQVPCHAMATENQVLAGASGWHFAKAAGRRMASRTVRVKKKLAVVLGLCWWRNCAQVLGRVKFVALAAGGFAAPARA
jgi:hypothetical protein